MERTGINSVHNLTCVLVFSVLAHMLHNRLRSRAKHHCVKSIRFEALSFDEPEK